MCRWFLTSLFKTYFCCLSFILFIYLIVYVVYVPNVVTKVIAA